VLDVKDGSIKEGAHLIVWPPKANDNANQQWYIEPFHGN
jgi:hypothetical protein